MVTRHVPITLWVAALLLAACSSGARDPVAVARSYEQLRIAGNLVPLYSMLCPADTLAVPRDRFPRQLPASISVGAGGLPSTTLDSLTRADRGRDTAVVAVFLTAPNAMHALGALLNAAIAGQDSQQLRRSAASALRHVPRITVLDTVRLVRTDRGWRIWLGITERRHLAEQASYFRSAGTEKTLQERAALAAGFLQTSAARAGFANASDLETAEALVRARSIADSLQFDIRVQTMYMLGRVLRGSVTNPTSADLSLLRLREIGRAHV
jgi:hypothetical protein